MRVPDMQPVIPPPGFLPASLSSQPASPSSCTTNTPVTHKDRHDPRSLYPHGLRMQKDFISPAHEEELIRLFREELEWPARGKGRVSLHYGYTFSYKTFGIDDEVPFREFPAWLRPLIPLLPLRGDGDGEDEDGKEALLQDNRPEDDNHHHHQNAAATAAGKAEVQNDRPNDNEPPAQTQTSRQRQRRQEQHKAPSGGRPPDQVCLQYYPPGTGIPPHVDTHSTYDELYALSLGAPVLMQFRLDGVLPNTVSDGGGSGGGNDDNSGSTREAPAAHVGDAGAPPEDELAALPSLLPPKSERPQVDVDLLPRSMLEMSGDSRLHWTHGIKPRKTDTLTDRVFGRDHCGWKRADDDDDNDNSNNGRNGAGPDNGDEKPGTTGSLPLAVVRPREDRWSITYRWLRKETPAQAQPDPPPPPLHDVSRLGDQTGRTRAALADDHPDKPSTPKQTQRTMVRECECGDILLCDTAQRRRGQEREYRWKQYDAGAGAGVGDVSPSR